MQISIQSRLLASVCLAALTGSPAPGQRYSEWSQPMNLGPVINTACSETIKNCSEAEPFVSRDGLALYFTSDRPGGFGGTDVYVSRRACRFAPWGRPESLGPVINTSTDQGYPTLSNDGHRLYFRDTAALVPTLDNDIYVSRRKHKVDYFGWNLPANLGVPLNSTVNDACLTFAEENCKGATIAYFQSSRTTGVSGKPDIYATTMNEDGIFSTPTLVVELSTTYNDRAPSVRRDGLEIYFDSNRPGATGSNAIWVSTRETTADPWSPPVPVNSINRAGYQGRASLSFDATELYFFWAPPGSTDYDLYVSTRVRLRH